MRTKSSVAATVLVLSLVTVAPALAGATDGSRQVVSPATWQQQEPRKPAPYALTGKPEGASVAPPERGRRREVRTLGNKVEIDTYRR